MGGRVKVLRSIPRRSLGGVFQASASRHSMRSPPHNGMSPRNPWTWGGGLFHRTDGSTGQCGVEREQRPQRKKVHWGQDGVLPPVCRLSYWR